MIRLSDAVECAKHVAVGLNTEQSTFGFILTLANSLSVVNELTLLS